MTQATEWEAVIGLEIHAELNTKSKLFSTAPNRFGDAPNTNVSVVCTGQPGALPVLNKEAVQKAVLLGCALDAEVCTFSKFDRKSYFYPDSPRNFQITQFDHPIIKGGTVTAEVDGKDHEFAIHHVHLEDDAGMLKHHSSFTGIDYNRAGVPLVEIVSEPCMHTPQQASAYARMVRAILQYIDVCDCNMQEGSLRFDANISVRKKGETSLRTKVEIKNMNSFSIMEQALAVEIKRQIGEYRKRSNEDPSKVITQDTYRWDPDLNKTVLMRRKESSEDYLYFPEPDLVPIVLEPSYIESVRKTLPELPLERERRYVRELELSPQSASILAGDKVLADYFEKALEHTTNARALCNWLVTEFPGRLEGQSLWEIGVQAAHVGSLVQLIDKQTITGKIAKQVATDMVNMPGKSPEEIVANNPDYQAVHDSGEIEKLVDQVIEQNPQSVSDFKGGKQKAFGFLVGQVMKLSRGKASPQVVNEWLRKKLS